MKYKCCFCGSIIEDIGMIELEDGRDYTRCPKCGEIDPGFLDVEEPEDNADSPKG